MMTLPTNPVVVSVTTTKDFEVPIDFYDTRLGHNDLFILDHCGYWARGVRYNDRRDMWVVLEWGSFEEELPAHTRESGVIKAIVEYKLEDRMGEKPFPEVFDFVHILDVETCTKAAKHGIEIKGPSFFEDYDGNDLDSAFQIAILGSIVYA